MGILSCAAAIRLDQRGSPSALSIKRTSRGMCERKERGAMIQAVSDIYYKAQDAYANVPCEVRIETDGEIAVSFHYETGSFRGRRRKKRRTFSSVIRVRMSAAKGQFS
jgi:hypothetical protein